MVSPEVGIFTKFITLRCSRLTPTKPDDTHTWCVGKPLPVTFQRAICEYHRETLRSIAKCANLEFVTLGHFSQPQKGGIVCERPSTRTKIRIHGFLRTDLAQGPIYVVYLCVSMVARKRSRLFNLQFPTSGDTTVGAGKWRARAVDGP